MATVSHVGCVMKFGAQLPAADLLKKIKIK